VPAVSFDVQKIIEDIGAGCAGAEGEKGQERTQHRRRRESVGQQQWHKN
jgi:hypothetical protein